MVSFAGGGELSTFPLIFPANHLPTLRSSKASSRAATKSCLWQNANGSIILFRLTSKQQTNGCAPDAEIFNSWAQFVDKICSAYQQKQTRLIITLITSYRKAEKAGSHGTRFFVNIELRLGVRFGNPNPHLTLAAVAPCVVGNKRSLHRNTDGRLLVIQ